ncbi:MAG TPA: hypothetical protein PKD18_00835 [Saprospiraceae bacterium]|nr:hypothetical protein [Saprospiraceae bacterium]
MKSTITPLLLLLLAVFTLNCKNQNKDEAHANLPTAAVEEPNIQTINLNDGEKWAVNEEMKPFISDSEKILNEFIAKKSNDFISLAAQLKEKNAGLVKSCTMQGASHDELHKWLHPHMELIKSLADAGDLEAATLTIDELKESFVTYNQFFQ